MLRSSLPTIFCAKWKTALWKLFRLCPLWKTAKFPTFFFTAKSLRFPGFFPLFHSFAA